MPGHRNCCVVGCANSGARLEKWMAQVCTNHECLLGQGRCDCPPPFTLFPFPTEKRDESGRLRWQRLINRKDAMGKNWKPSAHSRLCSMHFIDGKPTDEHPDPTLYLGYPDKTGTITKARRNPMTRRSSVVVPTKKLRKNDDECNFTNLPISGDLPETRRKYRYRMNPLHAS